MGHCLSSVFRPKVGDTWSNVKEETYIISVLYYKSTGFGCSYVCSVHARSQRDGVIHYFVNQGSHFQYKHSIEAGVRVVQEEKVGEFIFPC